MRSPAGHPTRFSEFLASGPQPRAETSGGELELRRALGWAGVLAKEAWPRPKGDPNLHPTAMLAIPPPQPQEPTRSMEHH